MKMNMKKTSALIMAAVLTMSLAACGETETADAEKKDTTTTTTTAAAEDAPESAEEEESAAESADESQAEEQPEEKEQVKYLGEEDAEAADYSVELTNGTDRAIVGFAIKYGNESYSGELIPDGETFEVDEVRLFNWSNTVSGDVMTLDDYTVELTFDNDKVFELHGFPLTDMLSGEIRLMEDYAFLVYTNKIGDNKNTMDSEAAAAEKARADSEAATATTTTTTTVTEPEPVYEEPVTEEPVVTDPPATEEPAVVPPSADDGCVGDDGFTF